MSIEERLDFLLQGRNIYPWAESIGLRGPIEGMRYKKSTPGGETLIAIRKCENVCIDWLLDGTGETYITSKLFNDEDAIELLDELLVEQWSIYVLSDGVRLAVVLTQPGSFDVKDGKDDSGAQRYRSVNHTIIEVIVGIFGVKLSSYLSKLAQTQDLRLVKLTEQQMSSLEKGQIGTYRLADKEDALLRNNRKMTNDDLILKHVGQKTLFTSSEEELLVDYRAITPDEQKAVTQIIDSMAKIRRMR